MPEYHYEKNLNIKTTDWDESLYDNRKYHRYEPTPYAALDTLFNHISLTQMTCLLILEVEKDVFHFMYTVAFEIKSKASS